MGTCNGRIEGAVDRNRAQESINDVRKGCREEKR